MCNPPGSISEKTITERAGCPLSWVIQLAVPLSLGILSRHGNKRCAITGMLLGIVIVLTVIYRDDIPALGPSTSGIIGVLFNALVFVGFAVAISRARRKSGGWAICLPSPRRVALQSAPG
jgi:Na+/proline symporter